MGRDESGAINRIAYVLACDAMENNPCGCIVPMFYYALGVPIITSRSPTLVRCLGEFFEETTS